MTPRSHFLLTLITCTCFSLLSPNVAYSANTEPGKSNDKPHITTDTLSGKVMDIIDAAGYTYAEVDTGESKVWAAGPVTALKTGDMIAFPTRMPMYNFHSKSLQRDFPVLYFVDRFITDDQTATPNLPTTKPKQKTDKTIKTIDKIKDGYTIAEVYSNKIKLKDKVIRVRGQVTKYTANILGKNWLHIMDNSTTNDLTITTNNKASVDDIVVIEGKLQLDKDFGYGYVYSLIIEDAIIK